MAFPKATEGDGCERIALRDNLTGQGLILTTMALMVLGVVMVYSVLSGLDSTAAWYERTSVRQAIFAAVGMVLLCTLWRADYHWLTRRLGRGVPSPAVGLLVVGVLSAAATLLVGHAVGGQRRWIRLGPVGFQPSEVIKIALLIVLAGLIGRAGAKPRSFWRAFLPAIVLIGVSVGLVVSEDFGTATIIGIVAMALLLVGGVRWYFVTALLPPAAAGFYLFVMRVPHRWARIEALLDPDNPANPATYHARQSLIAIGSGVDPAGLGGGAAKYGYLPESSTDFIYANICNELGTVGGGLLVIALLMLWTWLACRTASRAADRLGALLAAGLGFLVAFQAALHIAVNLRMAPPTGVSLPFISAGGSSLVLMSAATAVIVSVSARRRTGCVRGE